MPLDPHLADQMREALKGRGGVTEKRMFGGLCFFLNGNMLGAADLGRFMFRVGKDQEAEALARPGVEVVAFPSRDMRGFVWVDADAALDAGLDTWIDFAARYVGALPPK
jgi:TfoX/Sxy family transcriptional regulator of competence genes